MLPWHRMEAERLIALGNVAQAGAGSLLANGFRARCTWSRWAIAAAWVAAAAGASAHFPTDHADGYYPIDQPDGGFGTVLASGDFNCDGLDDLAIGAPWGDLSGVSQSGVVNIRYASPNGLFAGGGEWLDQDTLGILGGAKVYARFGQALASGDFNHDGCGDLVIGARHEDIGSATEAGAVIVVYGSSAGVSTVTAQAFHQDTEGLYGTAEALDRFGYSVAAGDFSGDGFDDLAIGVPFEDLGTTHENAGFVHVLLGSSTGLTLNGQHQIYAGTYDLPAATFMDYFGLSLAFGEVYPGREGVELVVGAPYRDVDGFNNAGMISVLFGDRSPFPANTDSLSFTQDSPGIVGALEDNDYFGSSLAIGDFNADGYADIAASATGEDVSNLIDVGMVIVMSVPGPYTSRAWLRSDITSLGESDHVDDSFGTSLVSADFDNDGYADLAIGVPFSEELDIGTQFVLYGRRDSLLSAEGAQELFLCALCLGGQFRGMGLASGHFDTHPGVDLVTGSPYMDGSSTYVSSGMVNVHYNDTLFRNGFD